MAPARRARVIQAAGVLASACVLLWAAAPAGAQSVLDRPPNLSGGWVGAPNSIYFHFLHRFNSSGAPQRQVTNRPTFLLAYRLPLPLLLGAHYATRSEIVARYPNEWELFARYGALQQDAGAVVDASAQFGYNVAAQSVDGEVSLARSFGRVRVVGAARAFSSAYGTEQFRFAAAGGATLRLSRWLALAGDVATVFDEEPVEASADDDQVAWGVALQLGLPLTPHSLSLQATNTNTATLQGASRGADLVRWGFEFTVPINLARYFGARSVAAAPPVAAPLDVDSLRRVLADSITRALQRDFELRLEAMRRGAAVDSGRVVPRPDSVRPGAPDTVRRAAPPSGATQPAPRVNAGMRNLAYTPSRIEVVAGTTIVWRNNDQVEHTVTAQDGSWNSGIIKPGQTWQRTFAQPGTHQFFCTPHPFMKGTVVVRPRP